MRRLIKTAVSCALAGSGADAWFGSLASAHNTPLVLCYHRVVENVFAYSASIPAMLTSRKMLESHLDWVARRYQIVSLDELGMLMESGERPRRPVAAVTFDDGYSDVYHNAFPLLKRKGIPAAVFVVTDLVGSSGIQLHDKLYLLLKQLLSQSDGLVEALQGWLQEQGLSPLGEALRVRGRWNALAVTKLLLTSLSQAQLLELIEALDNQTEVSQSALVGLAPLTWAMLAEMQQEGIIIGSHTKSHALLTSEDLQKVIDELVESQQELGRRLGIRVRHFAFPDGRFDAATVRAVAAVYRYGYTTCRHQDADYPLATIPRRHFWEHSSTDSFGRFSPAIMSCQVNRVFDWASGGCKQDHNGHPRRSQPLRMVSHEAL